MHPVLFEVPSPWGPLPIFSYGVMLGFSLVVAWYLVMYLGTRKEGIPREQMANAFIVTAIVAIVGARLLYVITNPHEFTDDPLRFFALREGGLVAYGGFLGGLLGSFWYWRSKEVSLLAWADVVAPTLGTGLLFTRIGCYLYGCDFGAPLEEGASGWLSDLGTFPGPGGVGHEHGSPAFVHHVQTYDLAPTASASLPVHPTQLYESLAGLALFGVTMLVWRYRTFRGQVVLVLTALYGLWRFFIEYVRDDPERGFYFGFSTSQLISLALVPVALLAYMMLRKKQAGAALVPYGAPSQDPDPSKPASLEAAEAKKPKTKKRKKKA